MFLQASVCPQGEGVCLSACWDTTPHPWSRHPPGSRHTPTADTPPEQTPPKADTPLGADTPRSRHTPPEQTPFRSRYPPEQTPPRTDTPQSRHPLRGDTTPGADTHTPSPRERRPLLRTVRILLECILVSWVNWFPISHFSTFEVSFPSIANELSDPNIYHEFRLNKVCGDPMWKQENI